MESMLEKLSFVNFGDICSKCNENCCKRFYAVLLPEEEKEFSSYSFTITTEKGQVRCIGSKNSKPCVFLTSNGLCSIYERRPFDCRLWPVVIYIDLKTREKVIYLDLECPAVRNKAIPEEIIQKLVEIAKNLKLDDEWLEKYTLAPWPNKFIEIDRYKESV